MTYRFVKNRNVKSCLLCQNDEISKIIDPIIFSMKMDYEGMIAHLESYGYSIEEQDLREHAKHIFVDKNSDRKAEEIEKMRGASNLDMVKDTLYTIGAIEQQYRDEGSEYSPEMIKLWTIKQKFMETKAKLEGELNEGRVVVEIPEWIKLIPTIENADVTLLE